MYLVLFLSTLSLRRATSRAKAIPAKVGDFYPRSPCGERLMTTGIKLPKPRFLSTLSLRRATNPLWLMGYDVGFLSTLSLRRATYRSIDRNNVGKISIHALLAESDSMYTSLCCGCFDFYPRSPCGERPACQGPPLRGICISIHALLAESDAPQQDYGRLCYEISIHALLAESDWQKYDLNKDCLDFYPRSPCGERLASDISILSR